MNVKDVAAKVWDVFYWIIAVGFALLLGWFINATFFGTA
jgi:hypothetical protein